MSGLDLPLRPQPGSGLDLPRRMPHTQQTYEPPPGGEQMDPLGQALGTLPKPANPFELPDQPAPSMASPAEMLRGGALMGKAIVDAPINLAKGALGLAKLGGYITDNPLEGIDAVSLIPGEERRAKVRAGLEEAHPLTKAAAEAVGTVLSFVSGAGEVGLVGKAAGLPGKAVEALGAPGMKLGASLAAKIPQASRWAPLAEQWLPGTVAGSTGFSLYNLFATEGGAQERAVAMAHGAAVGAALHVLGEAGRAVERAVFSGAKVAPELLNPAAVAKSPSLLRTLAARGVGSAIEGTGFAGLDSSWWSDMFSGDRDKQARALGVWMGSVAGVLAAKFGNSDAYLFFKRTHPELNTAALRQEAEAVSLRPEPAPGEASASRSTTPPGTLDAQSSQAGTPSEATARTQPETAATASPSPKATPLDPLYQAGWEGHGGKLEFPGSQIQVNPDGSLTTEGKTIPPEQADIAAQGIALHSLEARMIGEAVFGARGFHESGAGLPWIGDDGASYAIGLDSRVYRRNVPHDPGESWEPWTAPGLTDTHGHPIPPQDGPLAQEAPVQRWRELVQTLDKTTAPSAAMDVLHSAVETVARGNPDSPSVRELHELLATLPPEQVAPLITKESLPALAMELGKLGAGTGNAQHALQRLGAALQPQAHQVEATKASESSTVAKEGSTHPSQDFAASGPQLPSGAKERGRRMASSYYENQPVELRKRAKGSPEVDAYARDIERAQSRKRTNLGQVQEPLRNVERLSHGEAAKFLDQMVPDEFGGQSRRFTLLMHDRPLDQQAPDSAVKATDAVRDLMKVTGQQNQEAGNVRFNRQTEKYEPFVARDRVAVLPRQPGEDFAKVMNDPELRHQYAEIVAKGNGITVEQAEQHMEPLWRETEPGKRRASLEISRELKYMPDSFTGKDGQVRDVFEGRIVEAANSIAHSQAARAAVVSVFGPDFTSSATRRAYEKDYGPTKGGVEERLSDLAGKLPDQPSRDLARRMAAQTGGVHEAVAWLDHNAIGRGFAKVEGFRRAAETFRSFIYDIADKAAAYGMVGGWARLARQWTKLGMPFSKAYQLNLEKARAAGQVLERVSHYSELELRGLWSKARDAMTWLGRKTEMRKVVLGDMIANVGIERMRGGKGGGGDAYDAWVLGFSKPEIDLMMQGNGGELYTEFRHRLVAAATGNKLPGEGSLAHNSRSFKALLPYNSFFMSRANTFIKAAGAMATGPNKAVAASRMAQTVLGLTGSGAVGTWLAYLLSGKGNDQFLREMAMAPGEMLAGGAAGQLFGGLATTAAKTVKDAINPANDPAERLGTSLVGMAAPGRWAVEAAKLLQGRETVGEQAWKLMHNMGFLKPYEAIESGLNLLGTGDPKVVDVVRAIGRFKRDQGIPEQHNAASADLAFSIPMKTVQHAIESAINTGTAVENDPGVKEAVRQVLGVATGERISQSLRGRKIDFGDDKQREKLINFLGEDQYRLAVRYNTALDQLAKSYADERGTPPTHDDFTARLARVRHQASFGDPDGLKKLYDEVAAIAGERMIGHLPTGGEVDQLAVAITDHPALWPQILTEHQVMALRAGDNPVRTVSAFLLLSARDRALSRLRKNASKSR